MSNGKAAGPDVIPAEILKGGGQEPIKKLTGLYLRFWEQDAVLKDADIIRLYKRKDNHASCDNQGGITFLATAGKVLIQAMLNQLSDQLVKKKLPKSQYVFHSGHDTFDLIFALCQIQEKCHEQNQALHVVFVNLSKAFDSKSRWPEDSLLQIQWLP